LSDGPTCKQSFKDAPFPLSPLAEASYTYNTQFRRDRILTHYS
jgi:hypothetical protein